jgi:hypothetical protein
MDIILSYNLLKIVKKFNTVHVFCVIRLSRSLHFDNIEKLNDFEKIDFI